MTDGVRLRGIPTAWAFTGAAVAVLTFGDVNEDARLLVAAATVLGVGAAVLSAWSAARSRHTLAGALLIISAVITPTYFAWPLNVLALAAGIVVVRWRHPDRPSSATSPVETIG